MIIKKIATYFKPAELVLLLFSYVVITVFFFIFDGKNYLSYIASLLGATSLILNAKGNPLGQLIMIVFSVLYGIISYTFSYYGEMITYLGMTAPMALFALISWLRHPYQGKRTEVKVNILSVKEVLFMLFLSVPVTIAFYFILRAFHTANLLPSTLSVTTSFLAVYLTFRRSPFFALCYALNDVILIVLWLLATLENLSYVSVLVCFCVFLLNDLYGFINWLKMRKKQK